MSSSNIHRSSMRTRNKQQWKYGRFELRARIDTAKVLLAGMVVTCGVNKRWPENGEIDMVEYYRGKLLFNIAVADSKSTCQKHIGSAIQNLLHLFLQTGKINFIYGEWIGNEYGIALFLDDVLLNYQPQQNYIIVMGSNFHPFSAGTLPAYQSCNRGNEWR